MKSFIASCIVFLLVLSGCTDPADPKAHFDKGDYGKAYKLWLSRAEQGDIEAMNYLGIQYYLGLGMPRDYQQASNWFEQAASAGVADAQYNLGTMYENGEYFSVDYMKAYMWLYAAHENGNTNAVNRMRGIAGVNELSAKLSAKQVAQAEQLAEPYINKKSGELVQARKE